MKKIIIALSLCLFMSIITYAGVNEKALKKFSETYASATNAQWTTGKDFYKVAFLNNGQRMEVFYDLYGEPVALCRYLTDANLPANSLHIIKEKYPAYTINDVIQYESSTEGLKYYVKMTENSSGKTKTLAVSSQGNVSVYKRSKTGLGQP